MVQSKVHSVLKEVSTSPMQIRPKAASEYNAHIDLNLAQSFHLDPKATGEFV